MDKRFGSALAQYAHKQGHPVELAQAAQAAVEKSAPNLGPRSNSRKARLRLGKTLIDTQMHPEIWVPVCPDYSSDTNGYRFDALRSGVSLLARRHAAFLQPITKAVPGARVTVMYADLKARDRAIAQACGIDSITFLQRVDASIEATRRELRGRDGTWRVERMTDVIDNLPTRDLRPGDG